MISVSINTATKVYETQKNSIVSQTTILHQPFRDFSYQLTRFIQVITELSDDNFWSAPFRTLKRYRFEMSVSPLGFGNTNIITPEIIRNLEFAVDDCQLYYPNLSSNFGKLIESLKYLIEKNENPFLDQIKAMLTEHREIALVIKESRHIPVVEQILKDNQIDGSVNIVSESQLRKPDADFPIILCLGASRWFADYIFRAPRAENIIVMRFSWIKDSDCRANPVFSGWKNVSQVLRERNSSAGKAKHLSANYSNSTTTVNVPVDDDWLQDEDLIPRLDLSNVSKKFSLENSSTLDDIDKTAGRLFQLEGRRGVFLEADDTSTTLVIDLEDEERNRVHRSITNHIQAGMFVLLRTDEGEGNDYIIPIADKILGDKAVKLRQFQKKWKKSLKSLINTIGIEKVLYYLKEEGSILASENNVRNWSSERNIRTHHFQDFFAIMSVLGLKKEAAICWKIAAEIDSAHMQAGRLIRRQLLRKVLKSDLNVLEQLGEMRFELPEIGCKPLLALRVVRVSDKSVQISNTHLNKLFELEEDKWHG